MAFYNIQVYPGIHIPGESYKVQWYNPTGLPFLGAGAQGAVFQLSAAACVKVFAHEADAQQEAVTLGRASSASFIPQVYETGPNYIVMEFIQGQGIKTFLSRQQAFPHYLAEKLLAMIYDMKRVGFTRIDTALRHVYITPERQVKVIDHVNSYRTVQPYPGRMLRSLANIGYLAPFLHYVERQDPAMYAEWKQASVIPCAE